MVFFILIVVHIVINHTESTPTDLKKTEKNKLKNPQDMTFEEALRELETVVQSLEDGKTPLENAIDSYERGAALKQRCDVLLQNARLKVKEIYESRDGQIDFKTSIVLM